MANGQGRQRVVQINGIPVINNLSDAQNYAVNLNSYELITQSLYDSASYPAAGIGQLTFFQQPVGGSANGVLSGAPKSYEDTNMQAAGMMPNLQAFVITSIELDLQPGIGVSTGTVFPAAGLPATDAAAAVVTRVNDAWKIRATGFLNLTIGSKPYLIEGPLMKFPASNDFEVDAAAAGTDAALNVVAYGKSVGPSYMLDPNNLLLIPMQNFSLTLNWATLVTVTTPARIFARFMGQQIRAAQ